MRIRPRGEKGHHARMTHRLQKAVFWTLVLFVQGFRAVIDVDMHWHRSERHPVLTLSHGKNRKWKAWYPAPWQHPLNYGKGSLRNRYWISICRRFWDRRQFPDNSQSSNETIWSVSRSGRGGSYHWKNSVPSAKLVKNCAERPKIDLVGVGRHPRLCDNNLRSKIMDTSSSMFRCDEILWSPRSRDSKIRDFPKRILSQRDD